MLLFDKQKGAEAPFLKGSAARLFRASDFCADGRSFSVFALYEHAGTAVVKADPDGRGHGFSDFHVTREGKSGRVVYA